MSNCVRVRINGITTYLYAGIRLMRLINVFVSAAMSALMESCFFIADENNRIRSRMSNCIRVRINGITPYLYAGIRLMRLLNVFVLANVSA